MDRFRHRRRRSMPIWVRLLIIGGIIWCVGAIMTLLGVSLEVIP